MTVEELRAEAKAHGYYLIKIQPPKEKLLPCVCGCTRHARWWGTHDYNKTIFRCRKCGREASGRTEREARHNWNEMIKGEQKNEYSL